MALAQHQKAVGKARTVEAVANVRAIANAHQFYYIEHGKYLGESDMNKLDITIPGTIDNTLGNRRIKTKYFVYSPNGSSGYLGVAQRAQKEGTLYYYIYIAKSSPQRIGCYVYPSGSATTMQKKLCQQLETTGTL